MYYDRNGKACSPEQWTKESTSNNRVALTESKSPPCVVSTVYLGIDHNFGGNGHPLIFETMIFYNGGHSDAYCKRYATQGQALQGHIEAVKIAREELGCE